MVGLIQFTDIGNFQITKSLFKSLTIRNDKLFDILNSYGREGVNALRNGTPEDSGLAADSWNYSLEFSKSVLTITWYNTDIRDGFPVAVMLQYGHGTGTGGYVQGRDYINPIMKPVFDFIEQKAFDLYKGIH